MDEAQAIEHMRRVIRRSGKPAHCWASEARVSASYLSAVLKGRKPPGDKVLKLFGLREEAIKRYRRVQA